MWQQKVEADRDKINLTSTPGPTLDNGLSGIASVPRGHSRWHIQLQVSERRVLMMFGDSIAILVAVFIAVRVWAFTAGEAFSLEFIAWRSIWFAIMPFVWFILASANDYFNLRITSRIGTSLKRLIRILLQLLVVYVVLFFVASRDLLPRLFFLNYTILSFVLIGVWRIWQPFLFGWPGFRRRAVIVGTDPSAVTIFRTISQEANRDYEIIGFVSSDSEVDRGIPGLSAVGTGFDLPRIVQVYGVAELIVAYGSQLPGDIFQGVMACYEQGISIVPMPLLYEKITGCVPIEHVGEHYWSVVLPLESQPLSQRFYNLVKRLVDIIGAAVALLLFGLLLPFIALFIKLDSPGPVFYRQERIGRNGKHFHVFKLRSMIDEAERETGPRWASNDDPRVTRVGRLLRKMRVDEMPQLLNVLRGEMSLIGPRPERPSFVAQLSAQIPFYRTRLVVKPGITGWAQVCYRYGSSEQDALRKLQYDLYYIRHQSIALDLEIMVRTLAKVVALQGR